MSLDKIPAASLLHTLAGIFGIIYLTEIKYDTTIPLMHEVPRILTF